MPIDPRLEAIQRMIRDGYLNTAHDLLEQMEDTPEVRYLLREVRCEQERQLMLTQQLVTDDGEEWDEGEWQSPPQSRDYTSTLNLLAVIGGLVFLAVILYLNSRDRISLEEEAAIFRITATAITPRSVAAAPRAYESATPVVPLAGRGIGITSSSVTPTDRTYPEEEISARVIQVIGVDQIAVEIGGDTFRVAYLGIAGPMDGARCYEAAASFHSTVVVGKIVRLVRDETDTDAAGRLLRYVYVEGSLINALLLRSGYALLLPLPLNDRFQGELERAESEARRLRAGCYRTGGFGDPAVTQPIGPDQPTLACTRNACREFSSRSELDAYLALCPQDFWKFDRDNDGRTCATQADWN
jgi:micrococcal nuclease